MLTCKHNNPPKTQLFLQLPFLLASIAPNILKYVSLKTKRQTTLLVSIRNSPHMHRAIAHRWCTAVDIRCHHHPKRSWCLSLCCDWSNHSPLTNHAHLSVGKKAHRWLLLGREFSFYTIFRQTDFHTPHNQRTLASCARYTSLVRKTMKIGFLIGIEMLYNGCARWGHDRDNVEKRGR